MHRAEPEGGETGAGTATSPPLLSICIPTFRRRGLICALARDILAVDGTFELCVHVDGDADGTLEALSALRDPRLRVSRAENRGRAGALAAACALATGRFVMLFDDDDGLYPDGLRVVLRDCAEALPPGVVGYIYQLEDDQRRRVGSAFPAERSNFLALRADWGVRGDKKEVVLRDALLRAMRGAGGLGRRVPTSLFWTRLAIEFDLLCRNTVIGRKTYLQGGMSANIRALKFGNARPMTLLYAAQVAAFARRRYRSPRFFIKALAGVAVYGAAALFGALTGRLRGKRA